jgi:superfamily I DNA/RNA helicase
MRWNQRLQEPFLTIAGTNDSPLRVVAGPGTGKTFALMRRVMRLLEERRASPQRILVCTFTRTAAGDLSRELQHLAVPGASRIWAGTLHAFCFRLLYQAEVLQATGRVPRPLLDFEVRFMLEDLGVDAFDGVRECRRRIEAFNAAWARLQSDDPGWPQNGDDRRFHNALLAWLRFHRCMLIGELIPQAVQFLRNNPESPDRRAFDHVLVDEYQDLNRAEQVILDLLAGDRAITIVGDEDQSIYSFKFAHPEGIAEFPRTHQGTHDEDLLVCWRSPRLVVNMANSLIQNNATRSQRVLRPAEGCSEGEVFVVQWSDMQSEARGIAAMVNARVRRCAVKPGRVLILAPRRQLGYAVRDALNELGTPAHSFFNEEAFDGRPHDIEACRSQQAFTLLTLLANPEDVVALRCWCGFGNSSLRAGAWHRLRDYCGANGVAPHEALAQLAAGQIRLPYDRDLGSRYAELGVRLTALRDLRGQALIDALFPQDQEWAETFRLVSPLDEDGDDRDPAGLLEALRTRIIQPELPTDVEYVRVMSLHKSKGLTADMVVIMGCIRGMIPTVIPEDLSGPEQVRFVEEQRRLFFVALTRTRNILVLSNFAYVPRDLAHRMRVPVRTGTPSEALTYASRFLDELGPSCPATVRGTNLLQSEGITQ